MSRVMHSFNSLLTQNSYNLIGQNLSSPADQDAKSTMKLGDSHPLRILVVDDNELNLKLISVQFKMQGYNVDTATNGLIACEMAQANDYDLVCMDINMPVLNGLEASKRILSIKKRNHPYIVAVSSCNYDVVYNEVVESGISDFIPKPLSIKRIQELIVKAFEITRAS